MAAAIEPLEAGRDWQPAAGAALGAAEDATRDAIARAELAAAVQGAAGLPAVLADAAWHVDPAGGGADLVLAQAQAGDDVGPGPRGGGWRALPEAMLGQLPLIWNGVHGSAARELEHMAGDPRFDAPARAHLGEAAALAAEHPLQAPAILERALDNLAVGLDDPRRVELLTGEPVGPQVLPGRTIEEAGPTVHEGPRIPDDQGPQVLPGPAIEEQGPQVLADPVLEPIHDGIHEGPTIPEQDPADHVMMAAPPGPIPEGFRGDEASWARLEPHERETIRYLLSDENPVGNREVVPIPPAHVDPVRPDTLPPLQPGQEDRRPDILLDGTPTELKAISKVKVEDLVGDALAKKLSGAIASRVMDARGQASDVVVDLREQEGITSEVAETAAARAFGADTRGGLEGIRFVGPGFDETHKRRSQ